MATIRPRKDELCRLQGHDASNDDRIGSNLIEPSNQALSNRKNVQKVAFGA
jgi:hypothetical protein